jgi:hypothetical protein
MRSCEKIGMIAGLADESVCPTLACNGLHPGGAGAFACQPIYPQLLGKPTVILGGIGVVSEVVDLISEQAKHVGDEENY